MAEILEFSGSFDATDLTIKQIRQKCRDMNWPGFRINAEGFMNTDRLIVERMSKKRAYALGSV